MNIITDLPPNDPQGKALTEIFDYPWMSLESDVSAGSPINWRTIQNYPMRPRTLWAKYLSATTLVGVRFGSATKYGLLDIDKGSSYLNAEGIERIREALETIGICSTLLITSSANGGVHLYFPLPNDVRTFDLATAIRYCLESADLILAPGQLEAFPNVKTYAKFWLGEFTQYNGHRLPLQPGSGSVMLDDDLQPRGASLLRFLYEWEHCAARQDTAMLSIALEAGRNNHRKKPKRRSHPVTQWRLDLETDMNEGFTGHGQTNNMLKVIACYCRVFLRLEGTELADHIESMCVTREGFDQWSNHVDEIGRKSKAWARAAEKYYWPLGSEPARKIVKFDVNGDRARDAQQRIMDAVKSLASSSSLASGVRDRVAQIVAIAKTSAETLYKYLHLWHPSGGCVTDHTAGITADLSPPIITPPDPLNALSFGLLHTSPPLMKGVTPENPLKRIVPPG